ncbi:hypothetical protein [Blastococcus mobilis]|uniref:Uncharacterized protein n=1 Tax=Blastococcus mobilis TaxID=1938746 RepID=A0A238Y5N9_9ACTN|nr:hypothetical protein [Blastococcus mobilis]SNR66138.1 hypothetical protein SAMN06272737_117113 [Blastococcus mobilis]
MSDITFRVVDTSAIPEELAKAMQPIVLKWETAALQVAAAHDPQRPQKWPGGSVEELLDQRFKQFPAITKTRAESKADAVLTSARFSRRAERLLGVDIRSAITTPAVAPTVKFGGDELKRLADFNDKLAAAAKGARPDGDAGAITWDKLSLQFIRVACIDETNGLFGTEKGSDEISIGGALLDTDGRTNKVSPVDLGGSWDDGDVRDFKPPKSILGYSMRGGLTFPRNIFITLLLVERDGNGMQEIINKIVAKVAEEAKQSLTALLAGAVGAAVGGPVGALIGLAVGYAVDKIIDKILHLWDDVAFIPKTIEALIPSRQSMFRGSQTSSSSVVRFRGPGEYACRYQLQLSEMT